MKKVLALVLASAMALGMSVSAFAATIKATSFIDDGTTYTSLEDGYWTEVGPVYGVSSGAAKKTVPSGSNYDQGSPSNQTVTYSNEIRPADEAEDYIYLTEDMFAWENFIGTIEHRLLSSKYIRNSKLTVRTTLSSGSKAVDEIKLVNKDSRIEILYADEYVSTKELDFEFTVHLAFDGKRATDYGLTFVGTLENEIVEVFEDDDYVDLGEGMVADAQDFVKDVEVDLGNGVSIYTKMFKGKKYYGTATRDPDDQDDIVFSKYADIDNVVTLKTVGLNSTGDIVKLDTDYSDYYVYDKDLNYLGQSNEMLPYSTKYYLANRKLDVADDDGDDDGEVEDNAPTTDDDGELDNSETGGDDGVSNANANPSTGA